MKFKRINSYYLAESSVSRIYNHILKGNNFAIISPYRSEYTDKENEVRLTNFKKEVRNDGYGFNQLISRWVENGESFDEQALFIPNCSKDDAIRYGKEYNQSSVIVKYDNECKEICTNSFESYKSEDIVRTFNISSDKVLNISDAEEIFAKRKGGPASRLLKGNKSFHLSEVYEVEQARPSYSQYHSHNTLIFRIY